MSQIPTDLMNRATADEMRFLMTERAFRWNKMRRTRICYNAVPSSEHGKNIVPDEEVTPELENEVLEALKWWIIDDVYWYFRECVESMGVGVYLDIGYKNVSSSSPEVLDRSNNALNIHFSPYLVILSHTPVICDISSPERAWEFCVDVVETLYTCLEEDGYRLSMRTASSQRIEDTAALIDKIEERGYVQLAVTWSDMEYADMVDQFEYDSQLDALRNGVPIEDILA